MIKPIETEHLSEVIDILAAAYVTNPGHIAIFGGSGSKELELNRVLFQNMIDSNPGKTIIGAFFENRLAGVMSVARYPECASDKGADKDITPELIKKIGACWQRFADFFGKWAEFHPDEMHWHLGPIAVLPEMQGRGIGSRLLKHFCEIVDKTKVSGYLETDRPENVRFYEKWGFKVVGEEDILDTPCWFMWREAIL